MSDRAPTYTSLMAPAFEVVIQRPTEEIIGGASSRGERYKCFLQMVMAEVGRVDWASHELTPLKIIDQGERKTLQSAEAGPYLARSAFKDAATLINGCGFACKDCGKPELLRDNSAFGGRLLNSAEEMLRVSYLGDDCRQRLAWTLNDPNTAYSQLGQPLVGAPIRLSRQQDACPPGFLWSTQLSRWITKNTNNDPSIGCPARQVKSASENGSFRQLTRTFWDKLVNVVYVPAHTI